MTKLSHVGADGRARMVDVTDKTATDRQASAAGFLRCAPATLDQVRAGNAPKGPVIQTAELAGVMAAKRTADLIPLCHTLPLTKAAVTIKMDDELPGFRVESHVRTHGVTGVEMEALTAVSVAALTVVDMVKAVDKAAVISDIRVETKTGGKSGDWARPEDAPR
jgi:cyclic pyranopterin monophosphate synthase